MAEGKDLRVERDYKFWWAVVMIFLFCVALALPIIAVLTGYKNSFATTEGRDPAPIPGWPGSANHLKSFPDRFEQYANENFGLRSQLVSANNYLRFLVGVSGSDKVLVGRDGWLFLGAQKLVDDFRAINPPKTDLVDTWFRTMNQRNDFLAKHGIKMLIVVAPNKHSIYPEYMPSHITRSGNPSALDTLLQLAPSRGPSLQILDLRDTLIAKKSEYRLYHMTDSHWNAVGAFFSYDAIVGLLKHDFPTISPLQFSDFQLIEKQVSGLGNSRMLGISDLQTERGLYLTRKGKSRVIDREKLDEFRPITTQIVLTNQRSAPSAFVIGDSFLRVPLVFLEQSFSKTVAVDRRGRGFDRDFILQEKPDIVIFESVERSLLWENERE